MEKERQRHRERGVGGKRRKRERDRQRERERGKKREGEGEREKSITWNLVIQVPPPSPRSEKASVKFGAAKRCVCLSLPSSWHLNALSPVIGGKSGGDRAKATWPHVCSANTCLQDVTRCLVSRALSSALSHKMTLSLSVPKERNYLNRQACGFSPAHCSVFPLLFWYIEALILFLCCTMPSLFPQRILCFSLLCIMYYREMSLGLNQLCHLDHKS